MSAPADIHTAASIRDRDEREGRLARELRAAVDRADGMLFIHSWRLTGADATLHRLTITGIPGHAGDEIHEEGPDIAEAMDRALDRLHREEWDR